MFDLIFCLAACHSSSLQFMHLMHLKAVMNVIDTFLQFCTLAIDYNYTTIYPKNTIPSFSKVTSTLPLTCFHKMKINSDSTMFSILQMKMNFEAVKFSILHCSHMLSCISMLSCMGHTLLNFCSNT